MVRRIAARGWDPRILVGPESAQSAGFLATGWVYLTCRSKFPCYWYFFDALSIWRLFGIVGRTRSLPLGVDSWPGEGDSEGVWGGPEPDTQICCFTAPQTSAAEGSFSRENWPPWRIPLPEAAKPAFDNRALLRPDGNPHACSRCCRMPLSLSLLTIA